ncbi:hypothetical protein AB1283_07405 [Bacillus sp. S13(2024)]|uniref:hypothetical protein n=1 Tax=unclassified Bacillus (in: firmicutes) TaxID=185979 RepID=UPI003D1B654D
MHVTKVSSDDPNSYHFYMFHHLFNQIGILKEHIHIPNGVTGNHEAEAIYRMFSGEVSTEFPASVLRKHHSGG